MRNKNWKRMGLSASIVLFVVFWACAAPGPGGSAVSAAVDSEKPKSETKKSRAVSPIKTKSDRILGVQLKDAADETVVRIGGNGQFQDYKFRKLGENQFSLTLGDIDVNAELPVLPSNSGKVGLAFAENKPAQGIEIVGSLNTALDHYIINKDGNDLVVNLYFKKTGSEVTDLGGGSGAASAKKGAKKAAAGSDGPARSKGDTAITGGSRPGSDAGIPEFSAKGLTPDIPGIPGITKKQYTGKPISLDLIDADLRNVLRLIADLTGQNIVIEPDVSGRVTLKVEQVPWDQVLDMIISMNDLGKEQVGSVIRIARQAKLKQEWTAQTDAIKAKQDLMETTKDLGELGTVYLSVSYAKASDVAARISEGKSDKGKVSVDERTSLIIYTDYPSRISNARQLLGRLDKPTPQVLIEARIVTLNSDVTRELGGQFRFLASTPNPEGVGSFQDFVVNSPTLDVFGMAISEVIGKTLVQIDWSLKALETANEARVMAAPRVMTMNNVKAIISQGVQIPYLKVGDTASNITATEFKDAVLELQVTPHITPDRKVRMTVEAKQDEPSLTIVGAQGQPGIDTRKISTELLLDDGGVVVIGGVIRNRDTAEKSSTPGLSDVPILGRLFKQEQTRTEKTELLIFISPKIVEASRPAERS